MPGIESRIGRKIGPTKAKTINHLLIKRLKISGVTFIKRLGILGQNDITILRVGGSHNPQIFFLIVTGIVTRATKQKALVPAAKKIVYKNAAISLYEFSIIKIYTWSELVPTPRVGTSFGR